MALLVRPFELGDQLRVRLDHVRSFGGYYPSMDNATWQAVRDSGPTFTGVSGDRVLAVAGVVRKDRGVGEAWAMIDSGVGFGSILPVYRAVKRGVDAIGGFSRIEALVDKRFPVAERWVRLLGFEFDRTLPNHMGDGREYLLYAKAR